MYISSSYIIGLVSLAMYITISHQQITMELVELYQTRYPKTVSHSRMTLILILLSKKNRT